MKLEEMQFHRNCTLISTETTGTTNVQKNLANSTKPKVQELTQGSTLPLTLVVFVQRDNNMLVLGTRSIINSH